MQKARLSVALAATTASFLLAACGASNPSSTNAASRDPALTFARCMRAHGVTNFPDPNSEHGFTFAQTSGLDAQGPTFQSAQRTCAKYLPKRDIPTMSPAQRLVALRFARCMRANGEPSFPDPLVKAPTPSGAPVRILGLRGMFFVIGADLDPRSPAFRQAATTCGVRLPPGPPSK